MVFYLAARDPISGPIWMDLADHPYALVAKLRHELYYGDPQKAKNKLNGILQDEGFGDGLSRGQYPGGRDLCFITGILTGRVWSFVT